jgi:hypothetical protein
MFLKHVVYFWYLLFSPRRVILEEIYHASGLRLLLQEGAAPPFLPMSAAQASTLPVSEGHSAGLDNSKQQVINAVGSLAFLA